MERRTIRVTDHSYTNCNYFTKISISYFNAIIYKPVLDFLYKYVQLARSFKRKSLHASTLEDKF
jgi:hypothetical protein